MIRTFRAVTLLVFLCLSFNIVSAQDAPVVVKTKKIETFNDTQYYVHVVGEGQTLYSISRVYETPIADLVIINPGLTSSLTPGQIIKIPVVPGEAPELKVVPRIDYDTTVFFMHNVLKGETLYQLSKQYNTSIPDIQNANDGLPGGLKTGTEVLIPKTNIEPVVVVDDKPVVETVNKEEDQRSVLKIETAIVSEDIVSEMDTAYIDHVVLRRETLYGISRRYNVSMDQIIKSNPLLKERKPQNGEVLRIPQIETVINGKPETVLAVSFVEHKVFKGETLWSISQKYGVTVEDILLANPNAQKGIKRRKVLKIPVFQQEENIPVVVEKPEETIDEIEAGNTVVKITEAPKICHEVDHNKEFQIALMLPLYLDEEKPEEMEHQDDRSLRFLDFYKGTRMAVDSLSKMGMKINLKVYDVDNSSKKINEVLHDPELESADLIIGPLFKNAFPQVARFAKEHNIPIVNPLTKNENVIRNNPNVFKVQVPEDIHLKLIAHSIRKNYPESNIVLVRHNPHQDKDRADAIREALKGKLKDRVLLPNSYLYNLLVEKSYNDTSMHDGELYDTIYIENTMFKEGFLNDEVMSYTTFPNKIHDLIYTNDTIYGFTKYASLARKNIFVSLTDDKVFTMEVLSRLNSLKDTFNLSVYTLPGVLDYELETDFLSSMDMHVSGSGYLDFGTDKFEGFEDEYFARWGHYPENQVYACLAYDIGMYFGTALYRFGSAFGDCLPNHQYESLYMNFFFVGQPAHGYENGFASIYRIHEYHFVPEEELLYSGE